MGDRERFLEHLEPFAERRERETERSRLILVPGGPDTEPCAPTGQDVEGGGRLDPESRVPVVDATDHQSEARAGRVRSHEPERRPAFEHRLFRPAVAPDLEEMVHDPDRIEAGVVGRADDVREGRTDRFGAARPRERVDLEAELHRCRAYQFAVPWPRTVISTNSSSRTRNGAARLYGCRPKPLLLASPNSGVGPGTKVLPPSLPSCNGTSEVGVRLGVVRCGCKLN